MNQFVPDPQARRLQQMGGKPGPATRVPDADEEILAMVNAGQRPIPF